MSQKFTNYTGVRWVVSLQKWKATLRFEGEDIICGFADNDTAAARLRDLRIIALNMPASKLQVLKPVI